jgi:hypothetical protein
MAQSLCSAVLCEQLSMERCTVYSSMLQPVNQSSLHRCSLTSGKLIYAELSLAGCV